MSARDDLFESMMPWHRNYWERGEEENVNSLLDAYRAEVLREAADVADRLALEFRDVDDVGIWPEEWSSRDVRDAVQTVAGELRRTAEWGGEQ
jgi:hypothetical protein